MISITYCFAVFICPIVQPTFCFSCVKIITIPTTTFIYNVRTVENESACPCTRKNLEKLDAMSVYKNYVKVNIPILIYSAKIDSMTIVTNGRTNPVITEIENTD